MDEQPSSHYKWIHSPSDGLTLWATEGVDGPPDHDSIGQSQIKGWAEVSRGETDKGKGEVAHITYDGDEALAHDVLEKVKSELRQAHPEAEITHDATGQRRVASPAWERPERHRAVTLLHLLQQLQAALMVEEPPYAHTLQWDETETIPAYEQRLQNASGQRDAYQQNIYKALTDLYEYIYTEGQDLAARWSEGSLRFNGFDQQFKNLVGKYKSLQHAITMGDKAGADAQVQDLVNFTSTLVDSEADYATAPSQNPTPDYETFGWNPQRPEDVDMEGDGTIVDRANGLTDMLNAFNSPEFLEPQAQTLRDVWLQDLPPSQYREHTPEHRDKEIPYDQWKPDPWSNWDPMGDWWGGWKQSAYYEPQYPWIADTDGHTYLGGPGESHDLLAERHKIPKWRRQHEGVVFKGEVVHSTPMPPQAVLQAVEGQWGKDHRRDHETRKERGQFSSSFDVPWGYDAVYPQQGEVPPRVYHVAPTHARENILANGLDATGRTHNLGFGWDQWNPETGIHGNPDDPDADYEYRPEGVYAFNDYPRATQYVSPGADDIWEINTQHPSMRGIDVIRDPSIAHNWGADDYHGHVFEHVPPQALRMVDPSEHLANVKTAMVAMTTLDGTAVDEAALCDRHDSLETRQRLEAQAGGDVVPGSWIDVSDNDYIQCSMCGMYDSDSEWNDEADPNEDLRSRGEPWGHMSAMSRQPWDTRRTYAEWQEEQKAQQQDFHTAWATKGRDGSQNHDVYNRRMAAASRTKLLQMATRLPHDQSQIVHDFGNGWTVRQLQTNGDRHREGHLMSNCWKFEPQDVPVDNLTEFMRAPIAQHRVFPNGMAQMTDDPDSDTEWMSLRDPDNLPHVSFFNDHAMLTHLLGTHNASPKDQYVEMLRQYAYENGHDFPGFVATSGMNGPLPDGFQTNHTIGPDGSASITGLAGGQPVGRMQLKPTGEVDTVAVHPNYYRRGIATELWNHAQQNGLNPQRSPLETEQGTALFNVLSPHNQQQVAHTAADDDVIVHSISNRPRIDDRHGGIWWKGMYNRETGQKAIWVPDREGGGPHHLMVAGQLGWAGNFSPMKDSLIDYDAYPHLEHYDGFGPRLKFRQSVDGQYHGAEAVRSAVRGKRIAKVGHRRKGIGQQLVEVGRNDLGANAVIGMPQTPEGEGLLKKFTHDNTSYVKLGMPAADVERWVQRGQVLPFAQHTPEAQKAIVAYMDGQGEGAWAEDIPQELEQWRASGGSPHEPEGQIGTYLDHYENLHGHEPFGITHVPLDELKQSIMSDRDMESYPDFDAWHKSYGESASGEQNRGVPEGGREIWPIVLDRDYGETIDDGWHRFHSYAARGIDPVPAIYFPDAPNPHTSKVAAENGETWDMPHREDSAPIGYFQCQDCETQFGERDLSAMSDDCPSCGTGWVQWKPSRVYQPGEQALFEYHCTEQHTSVDANLWYHSHQPCTVLQIKHDYDEGRFGYEVQFADGFVGSANDDELCESPAQYYRPDPPTPHTASPWIKDEAPEPRSEWAELSDEGDICPRCGAKMTTHDYCKECHHSLRTASDEACETCGAELDGDGDCNKCGQSQYDPGGRHYMADYGGGNNMPAATGVEDSWSNTDMHTHTFPEMKTAPMPAMDHPRQLGFDTSKTYWGYLDGEVAFAPTLHGAMHKVCIGKLDDTTTKRLTNLLAAGAYPQGMQNNIAAGVLVGNRPRILATNVDRNAVYDAVFQKANERARTGAYVRECDWCEQPPRWTLEEPSTNEYGQAYTHRNYCCDRHKENLELQGSLRGNAVQPYHPGQLFQTSLADDLFELPKRLRALMQNAPGE